MSDDSSAEDPPAPPHGRPGFGNLIGLEMTDVEPGYSRGELTVSEELLNPNEVLHGSIAHAMADSGMGAALTMELESGQSCATIEIKISYLRPVRDGDLVCETELLHRGGSVAFLESVVRQGEQAVARATGSFAIFDA